MPDAAYERVSRILSDSAFQDNATQLRDEANSRPAPAEKVPVLEQMVKDRRTALWRA